MTTLIFANGDLADSDWVLPYLTRATTVIAADGGTRHLHRLGRRPDYVIGDLDSLAAPLSAWLLGGPTRQLIYPPEKDATDLELALLFAAAHCADPLLLFGVLGGRLDQTIANIMLLVHPQLIDRDVRLVEPQQQAWVFRTATTIDGRPGDMLSLIPLGGAAQVATTTNLKWPLHDSTLRFGPARGVSNVLLASPATVTLHAGVVLCVHADGAWRR